MVLDHVGKDYIEQTLRLLIDIHNEIIEKSGGEKGVRDQGGLYNSICKISNMRFKKHEDPSLVAAFVYAELARRHHFNDGNKRTAHIFAKVMLFLMDFHLKVDYRSATPFIIRIAEHNSKITTSQIKSWIEMNLTSIDEKDIGKYINDVIQEVM